MSGTNIPFLTTQKFFTNEQAHPYEIRVESNQVKNVDMK